MTCHRQTARTLTACALLLSMIIGCSAPASAPDIGDLERRVNEWWSARQAGDVTTMYATFEPSFRRTRSLSDFGNDARRMLRIPIEKPRIVAVSRIPNSNRAVVTLVAQTKLARANQLVDMDIRDEWTFEEGQWWRVYVPPRTPFE